MANHFSGATPDASDVNSEYQDTELSTDQTTEQPALGSDPLAAAPTAASSVSDYEIDALMAADTSEVANMSAHFSTHMAAGAPAATGAHGASAQQAVHQPVDRASIADALPSIPDAFAEGDPLAPSFPQDHAPIAVDAASQPSAEYEGDPSELTNIAPQTTPQASGDPVILMEHVSLVYPAQPNKPALEDVNLEIYPGEFVFVVGHSGSGKSTFLKTITRELKVSSGKVVVAGQNLTRMRRWKVPFLRRQIGTVYQDFKLLPDKTIYENVAFALECIGKPRSVIKAQVPEVLRLVGLAEKMDKFPDQLSGGEQQRVSVARAMVNRPPLLVCDEPTGNLDPAISLGIMKLLERINRTGTTVVMATHDREMVDSMRKRVIALENGHIVRDQERGGYGYYGAL